MEVEPLFRDRRDAGRKLAAIVKRVVPGDDTLVLALPRGGVPVGYEIARALRADLDIFLVRKLGFPGQEELAIGAIASGGVRVLNEQLVRELRVHHPGVLELVAVREEAELKRRETLYRQGRPAVPIAGRVVILVDDGLATGASMRAAVSAVRLQGPKKIIVAVPLGSDESCRALGRHADDVLCLQRPEPFTAVGMWYENFAQTTDEEVHRLLRVSQEQKTSGADA